MPFIPLKIGFIFLPKKIEPHMYDFEECQHARQMVVQITQQFLNMGILY